MRVYALLLICVIVISTACALMLARADQSPAPAASAPLQKNSTSAEDEVINNILAQQVGMRTLADDALPRDFLRRMANRIICESFEDQFRIVIDDGGEKVAATALQLQADAANANDAKTIRVVEREIAPETMAYLKSLHEARPRLRGYRAPILHRDFQPSPLDVHSLNKATWEKMHEAKLLISKRLAHDGVLRTTQLVIHSMGAELLTAMDDDQVAALLQEVGLPVDLLDHFQLKSGERGIAMLRTLVNLAGNQQQHEFSNVFGSSTFDYQPTRAGFRVATESGEHDIAMVRAQLTRGDYWLGEGDGGNLDMVREMIASVPQARFIVSIETKHANRATGTIQSWPEEMRKRITLVAEHLPVSQWAQDNGKPGIIDDQANGAQAVTLVPRYASRGDDGSTFVPGEAFLAEGLREAGLQVAQSPLLFQGGNLLAVQHPTTGERILLIGEAEVYRNLALGLSETQILEAFRIEFGVDRVHKLPTTSFHIDYDVTIRAVNGELVAFVNDDEAAAKIIISCGVEALHKAKLVSDDDAATARNVLAQNDVRGIVSRVWPILQRNGFEKGSFPLSFAHVMSVGLTDSGVGNLHRFVLAFDLLASRTVNTSQIADANLKTYYEALQFQRGERDRFHDALAELGFHVVPVPSVAHGARSVNAINGIHSAGKYLMPAHGGLYAPLDEAAKKAIAQIVGEAVDIALIRSAESQRRNGAVHCAFSVFGP